MEGFTIREATHADKDEVTRIREEPTDYLADYYDHFMASPNITSFVLCHKDRIVGFNSAFIVDDGQTLVARSARVHPDYEGRGLFRDLDRHTIDWAKQRQVLCKVMTTSDENKHIESPSFLSVYKLVTTMKIMSYFINVHAVKLFNKYTQSDTELILVTEDLMSSYICCKPTRDYLFPCGRVLVDGVPFKLMQANVPLMFEQRAIQTIFSNVTCITETLDEYKGLLSIGTIQRVKEPAYIYNIEIYGNDVTSLAKHLHKHLDVIKNRASDVACVFLFVLETVSEDIVDDIFLQYDIARKVWIDKSNNTPCLTKRLVFEKRL